MTNKIKYILFFLIALIAIILVNVFSSNFYTRFDLTAEKRFTLTDATVAELESLDDSINIQVFLAGDVPLKFMRMQREVEDMLIQFQDLSDGLLSYEFVDLQADGEEKEKKYNETIARFGLGPYMMEDRGDKGETVQLRIYPCALVGSKRKGTGVRLFQTKTGASFDQMMHASMQTLEFEFLNAIKKLNRVERAKIAMISNKGCLSYFSSIGAFMGLKEHYDVERRPLRDSVGMLDKYDVVIIPGPVEKFTEAEKFVIDQYIMQGGNVMWSIDQVHVPYDSLAFQPYIMASHRDLNIDDMLFKYGARVNKNLVLDAKCAQIPVNIAPPGERADFKPAPWYYFPLIEPEQTHPITKNLDLIRAQFVGAIDTVGSNDEVKKTVLLETSNATRVQSPPFQVNFEILGVTPDGRFFTDYEQTVGILMEGKFLSVFAGRPLPKAVIPSGFKQMNKSEESRQIVISDGDILRNDIRMKAYDTLPFPLGHDKFTKQIYGNKAFLLNSINYLMGETDLMQLRARELQNRLLSKTRVSEERVWWQMLNVAVPIILVIIAGIVIFMVKRMRYRR